MAPDKEERLRNELIMRIRNVGSPGVWEPFVHYPIYAKKPLVPMSRREIHRNRLSNSGQK